jgi:hypothetical protein
MAIGLFVGFFHFNALFGFLAFFVASFVFQIVVNLLLGENKINQSFQNRDTLHSGVFSDFSVF